MAAEIEPIAMWTLVMTRAAEVTNAIASERSS
jgi:hypothetical protein